jgi:hypothetical protein
VIIAIPIDAAGNPDGEKHVLRPDDSTPISPFPLCGATVWRWTYFDLDTEEVLPRYQKVRGCSVCIAQLTKALNELEREC